MTNRKGFTLIELLIVVVIIGILVKIAIPKFAYTKEKAVLATMRSDLRTLIVAQEAFFSDKMTYATGMGPTQTATKAAFVPSSKNVVTLSTVTAGGWAAQATNTILKSKITKCGIFIGKGTAPNKAVTKEGAPACY